MNYFAFGIVGSLLLGLGISNAQSQPDNDSRKVAEQMARAVYEQCRRTQLLVPSTRRDNATSIDVQEICSCQGNLVKALITPDFIRRDSPSEGLAVRTLVNQSCIAKEFFAAFARDCPAIVVRADGDLDSSGPNPTDRRLRNAGGPEKLCSCLNKRFQGKPVAAITQKGIGSFGMLNAARRKGYAATLTLLSEPQDQEDCGWTYEALASGPPVEGQEAAASPSSASDQAVGEADLQVVRKTIDSTFAQWAAQWMWDRYIRDSILVTENQTANRVTLIRGTFKFSRGGGIASIPFASTLQKQQSNWVVTSLCYNDTTSGMTDCSNSGVSAAARRFMGIAIAGGLISAISGYSGSGKRAPQSSEEAADARNREVEAMNREREEINERNAARQRENDELDRSWSKMFEPSPLLPPPRTLN